MWLNGIRMGADFSAPLMPPNRTAFLPNLRLMASMACDRAVDCRSSGSRLGVAADAGTRSVSAIQTCIGGPTSAGRSSHISPNTSSQCSVSWQCGSLRAVCHVTPSANRTPTDIAPAQ